MVLEVLEQSALGCSGVDVQMSPTCRDDGMSCAGVAAVSIAD